MKKLLSTKYSAGAFNAALLLFRLTVGLLMMHHGYEKLINFGAQHAKFMSFLGMGSTFSYAMVIFAEFFCALFIVIGLFTRLSAIPLIITMAVALFKTHNGDVFGEGEHATLFLVSYVVLLLIGPGKISVDGMTGK